MTEQRNLSNNFFPGGNSRNRSEQENQNLVVGASSSARTRSSTISTTTTTGHTDPGVRMNGRVRQWTDEEIELIWSKYQKIIGVEINAAIGDFLRKCMYAGMDAYVVLDAIDRTGWARNPSGYYLRAILRRYLAENLLSLDDVMADEAEREQDKRKNAYMRRREWFY